MSETPSIEFALHGKVEGVEITPRTIGLSQFNEFNQQVEMFVGGSQKLKLDQVHVEKPRRRHCAAGCGGESRRIVEQPARRCGVGNFDYIVTLDPSPTLEQRMIVFNSTLMPPTLRHLSPISKTLILNAEAVPSRTPRPIPGQPPGGSTVFKPRRYRPFREVKGPG
jgi:hypothetical protein